MTLFSVDKYTLSTIIYNNQLLRLHLSRLKWFGLIVFFNQNYRRLNIFRGFCFTLCFAVFNVTQFIDLLSKWGNIEEMTNNAATTLLFFTTVVRLILFYFNWTKFCNIIKQVGNDTTAMGNDGSDGEKVILDKHVYYSNGLTLVFWSLTVSTGSIMCINSFIQWFLLDSSTEIYIKAEEPLNFTTPFPPLILQTWFPVENKWKYFYLINFVQCFNMFVGILIVPCWHSFMVALMMYPIIVMEQISYKLEHTQERIFLHIQEYVTNALDSSELQEQLKLMGNGATLFKNRQHLADTLRISILVNCVKRHLRANKFVEEFQYLTSDALFMDFIIYSILICGLLFQASKSSFGIQLTIHICYILSMVAILAMYYWHANEINLYSNQISSSIYKSNWYDGSAEYKKMVGIFLTSTEQPIILKAVFIDITINTFLNILRASYSYFTILTQMESS